METQYKKGKINIVYVNPYSLFLVGYCYLVIIEAMQISLVLIYQRL